MLLSLEAGSSIFVFVPVFDTMVKRAAAKSRAQQMGPPPSAQPEAECLADRGFQRQSQCKVSRAEGFKAKVKAATLKCIRDNFRDFSDEEVYHVRPEGTQKKCMSRSTMTSGSSSPKPRMLQNWGVNGQQI